MKWAKILSIEAVAEEDVYDVEIEGTHNFVGNGIVAHNTYLTGGLGAGVLNTTSGTIQSSGNMTAGGVLAINGTTGTTTIAAGQRLHHRHQPVRPPAGKRECGHRGNGTRVEVERERGWKFR